jgi:hypothetical protein
MPAWELMSSTRPGATPDGLAREQLRLRYQTKGRDHFLCQTDSVAVAGVAQGITRLIAWIHFAPPEVQVT